MKRFVVFLILILSQQLFAQDKKDYYEIAGKFASDGEYEKAIENYNKAIDEEPKIIMHGLTKVFVSREWDSMKLP